MPGDHGHLKAMRLLPFVPPSHTVSVAALPLVGLEGYSGHPVEMQADYR